MLDVACSVVCLWFVLCIWRSLCFVSSRKYILTQRNQGHQLVYYFGVLFGARIGYRYNVMWIIKLEWSINKTDLGRKPQHTPWTAAWTVLTAFWACNPTAASVDRVCGSWHNEKKGHTSRIPNEASVEQTAINNPKTVQPSPLTLSESRSQLQISGCSESRPILHCAWCFLSTWMTCTRL